MRHALPYLPYGDLREGVSSARPAATAVRVRF